MPDTAPSHHPDPEVLLGYAAGNLDVAGSVLVATHLALCPRCRAEVGRLEAIGGALAAGLPPAALAPDALSAIMARLDEPAAAAMPSPAPGYDHETLHTVPSPLRGYLGGSLSTLPWKWRAPGIRELPVAIGGGPARATLIRIRPGAGVPAHTHIGVETTLVLRGAFVDEVGRFARGDVATAASDLDHHPVAATGEECICFVVIDGPLRLTGPLGRLLNRFVRL